MKKREIKLDIPSTLKKLRVVTEKLVKGGAITGYKSIFKGRGLEFDGYRSYNDDDDAGYIDWKASKRANKLLVKEFVEERTLKVFFLIDVSQTMVFGSSQKLKNVYAAEIAVSLAQIILNAGDEIGFGLFNDEVTYKGFPESGMKQFTRMVRYLTNPETYGGGFNIKQAIEFTINYLKDNAEIVFIISDFIGIADNSWHDRLKYLGTRYDTICFIIRDPRDIYLPKDVGKVMIEDPYTGKKLLIDSALLSTYYESYVKRVDNELAGVLNDAKIEFEKIDVSKPFVQPLIKLFSRRLRKWR